MATDVRTLLLAAACSLAVGCGDDGGGGGGDGGAGGGVDVPLPTAGGGPTGEGGGGAGGGSTEGVSCGEIWDCYDGCDDTDCTIACHDQGSSDAKQKDNALWECIFINDCDDSGCVEASCPAEQQACFG